MSEKKEKIRDYRDLIVWQKSMVLAKQVYLATVDFPKHEVYGLTSQIRRSAISVPSNIAEGQGREGTKVFARFLRIARCSLAELQTQIYLSDSLSFLQNNQFNELLEASEEVARMLRGQQNTLDTQLSALS